MNVFFFFSRLIKSEALIVRIDFTEEKRRVNSETSQIGWVMVED